MEYLDGEGTAALRGSIEAHLATCGPCQALAADRQHLSARLGGWQVDPAPSSFRAPASVAAPQPRLLSWRPQTWRSLRLGLIGLGTAAAIFLAVSLSQERRAAVDRQSPPRTEAAAVIEGGINGTVVGGVVGGIAGGIGASSELAPLPPPEKAQFARMQPQTTGPDASLEALRRTAVIRTASLRIVARDFAGVRAAVESIVADAGGFIDQMTATGDAGSARRLRGTLRVPSDRLGDTADRLRRLGEVVEDSQGSEDVGDQVVDLEARLASARATELRLTELLRNRTGKLSDVLDVERELARVRIDIERLNAQNISLGRRVSYARLSIDISEERKARIDSGPLSLSSRFRIASADGLEAVVESVVLAMLAVVRNGPQVILWILMLGAVWLAGGSGELLLASYQELAEDVRYCLEQPIWYPRLWRQGQDFEFAGGERQTIWRDGSSGPKPTVALKIEEDLAGRYFYLRLAVASGPLSAQSCAALKVSQELMSPVCRPCLNQRMRCCELPCVNASGTT